MKKTGRKQHTMLKLTIREIMNTFGRFFAVFAIIALGTGFFSGVRITTPVMVNSVDEYYRDNQLYDYRAISTLGWEEEDVRQLADEKGVRLAKGSWQYDVLCETKDGTTGVYKVHAITEGVNDLQLMEGRMPAAAGECLLDTRNRMDLELGGTIRFSGENDPDTLDAFSVTTFTVTGFVESSLYINFERGTTSIGNGTVLGFMYVPEQAFDAEQYTEIYMKLDSDPVIYSDEYETQMDELRPEWEELIQFAADNRYHRLYDDAKQELTDARQEFEDKKAEGEQELADAEKELADGKKELDDAAAELADGKKELEDAEKELADGKKELEDAEKELADGKVKLADAEKELADGKAELDDAERELADGREELDRNGETLASAREQLDDAAAQLADGLAQLDDGAAELADARAQLEAGWDELCEGKAQLDSAGEELSMYEEQLAGSRKTLDEARQQLDMAAQVLAETEEQLAAGEKQLAAGKEQLAGVGLQLEETNAQLTAAQEELDQKQAELNMAAQMGLLDEYAIAAAQAEIDAAQQQIEAGRQQYEAGMAAYQAGAAELAAREAELTAGYEAYEQGLSEYQAGYAEYEAGRTAYEQGAAEYEAGKAAYEQAVAEYEHGLLEYEAGVDEYNNGVDAYNQAVAEYNAGVGEYEDGLAEYNSGKELYDQGVSDYESGLQALQDARKEYESGKKDYEQAVKDYEKGQKEYEDGLAEYEDGVAEYEEGLAEYEDGVAEYEDARQTFDEEIADAEKELADAEKELEDLEEPDTYLLERTTNIGYACFETDSQIVEQVARVLPIFFILVAILVCMTTMTRMVDERRGQIGVLKGLGYSRRDIMMTFLAYSGSAAILGCVAGYAAGIILFPSVIWYAYEMMYIGIPLHYIIDWKLAAAVFVVSLGSTLGTTYLSCRSELMEPAASLMRPKAPKAGKRVFLEYIPAIWSRLKFMHKVSVRNIFRYKKRFFMMVVGISGCTALLLTGFGLKDSIATFVDAQYDNIQVAQVELVTDEIHKERLPDELGQTMKDLGASGFLYQQSSWDLHTDKKVKGVTVIVPADWSEIDSYFRLRSMEGEDLPLPGPGEALVSISVAEHYGLQSGDELLLRNEKMESVRAVVTGVFENHVYDYVLMSRETMEGAGQDYYINGAYVNFPGDTDIYEAQARLAGCEEVVSVSVFADFRERIANMMSSLNYVVLLIIMSAAALAFVVLYNLTNINIMERTREIATVKVLGFYRRETADYVFRENMFLTSIGMLAGLGLGVMLHGFIIDQIVVDLVYFKKEITPLSFLLSILLTFFFTFLVNRIMTFKLDKINMAESLKSVE